MPLHPVLRNQALTRNRITTLNPFEIFQEWHVSACADGTLRHPGAMCLSTTNAQGVPEARFVDLKHVGEDGFVFCTHLGSAKAQAIRGQDEVALTFWWDHVERQVRVVGPAVCLADEDADAHFAARPREAQLTSWASDQSGKLTDPNELEAQVARVRERFASGDVPRPEHWGGYRVIPNRFEFLSFEATRLHTRLVFEREMADWPYHWLQP